MKVLVVCTTGGSGRRQFGGAERFLAEMLPALAEIGIEVTACTPDDAVGAVIREAGVPWVNLGARSRVDLAYLREIRRLIDEISPDVVCAHLLSAAMHCRAALRLGHRRTPLIVTLHNSLWQYRDAAPTVMAKAAVQVNITLDMALRRIQPHTTVAVSEFEAAELRTRQVKDVRLIPNPLPVRWPAPERVRTPDPSRPIQVGYMARLEIEKGADLLGDLARALPEAEFRIAGTGVVEVPRLANVELLGHVDAVSFLARLDCVIVPSRVESFGRTALEALSLGVPVVHSGVGGLVEVTRHADGVLAYPSDLAPLSMAATIRKATAPGASVDERLAIAQWYQREFAFERTVTRWAELYRSVAHGAQ
jgi:glycosyltransferase involved in cell wall biosynthesis